MPALVELEPSSIVETDSEARAVSTANPCASGYSSNTYSTPQYIPIYLPFQNQSSPSTPTILTLQDSSLLIFIIIVILILGIMIVVMRK